MTELDIHIKNSIEFPQRTSCQDLSSDMINIIFDYTCYVDIMSSAGEISLSDGLVQNFVIYQCLNLQPHRIDLLKNYTL